MSSAPDFTAAKQQTIPFLTLPLEIRIKIYAHLLPPRHHTIVTLTSPLHINPPYPTSKHPYCRCPPPSSSHPTLPPLPRVGYKVLTHNSHRNFPSEDIWTEILRTCKQVKEEGEEVLYGGKGVEWDFGIHLGAMRAFWGERGVGARTAVRTVRFGREVSKAGVDGRWTEFCRWVVDELPNIREMELFVWGEGGSVDGFPVLKLRNFEGNMLMAGGESQRGNEETHEERQKQIEEWREWAWTIELLGMKELREARITWWRFGSVWEGGQTRFDSWLVGRMVGDKSLRDRMVKEGNVREGVVVLPGLGAYVGLGVWI